MSAHAMASALGRKAVYLSHFTPSMMAPQTLEAMLVQREPLLSPYLDHVLESLRTGSSHHTLLVGPRGIGKTHLISLLHHRLAKRQEAKDKALMEMLGSGMRVHADQRIPPTPLLPGYFSSAAVIVSLKFLKKTS